MNLRLKNRRVGRLFWLPLPRNIRREVIKDALFMMYNKDRIGSDSGGLQLADEYLFKEKYERRQRRLKRNLFYYGWGLTPAYYKYAKNLA